MTIYMQMPAGLRKFYFEEIKSYKHLLSKNKIAEAWACLENAHIIGQAYPAGHTRIHWYMLRFGFRIKDWREITGQFPRLIFGGVKSFVGTIPVGNTGGANVPALRPMKIPDHLLKILELYPVNQPEGFGQ